MGSQDIINLFLVEHTYVASFCPMGSVVILIVSCEIMYDVKCYNFPVPNIRVVIVFIIS